MEALGTKVKRLREALGLEPVELAERCELHVSHIHQIEAGKRKRLESDTLRGLSRGLGVPVDTLLDNTAEGETEATAIYNEVLREARVHGIDGARVLEIMRLIGRIKRD